MGADVVTIAVSAPITKPLERSPTTHNKVSGQKLVGKAKLKELPTNKKAVKRGWIEFAKVKGRRYARRRSWIRVSGQWTKTKPVRAREIPPMSEDQYSDYKAKEQAAKAARRRAKANRKHP